MTDVVTFGESMILLQSLNGGQLQYAPMLTKTIAGAESNLAVGLTRLGKRVRWISRVGTDPFGKQLLATLAGEGVDTRFAIQDELHPTGVYFKDIKASGDPHVYYYRRGSAASFLTPDDISEEAIREARLLHVTGITPALSESCLDTVQHAMRLAKRLGVTVSFDPNLRRKLWSDDVARKTLRSLIPLCDIFLPGIEEAEFLFGTNKLNEVADMCKASGVSCIVVKRGAEGSSVYTAEEEHQVEGFRVSSVKDTVGAGDAFAAGFLSSLLDHMPLQECLRRANSLGAMATQYYGDWEGLPTNEELQAFLSNKSQISR